MLSMISLVAYGKQETKILVKERKRKRKRENVVELEGHVLVDAMPLNGRHVGLYVHIIPRGEDGPQGFLQGFLGRD